jgi:hypothetical protein
MSRVRVSGSLARTLVLSRLARLQSMTPRSPSQVSGARCSPAQMWVLLRWQRHRSPDAAPGA